MQRGRHSGCLVLIQRKTPGSREHTSIQYGTSKPPGRLAGLGKRSTETDERDVRGVRCPRSLLRWRLMISIVNCKLTFYKVVRGGVAPRLLYLFFFFFFVVTVVIDKRRGPGGSNTRVFPARFSV